jgi:hypothetical protein
MESLRDSKKKSEQISIEMNQNESSLRSSFKEITQVVRESGLKDLSATNNKLVMSKKKLRDTEVKTLSSQQRWYAFLVLFSF